MIVVVTAESCTLLDSMSALPPVWLKEQPWTVTFVESSMNTAAPRCMLQSPVRTIVAGTLGMVATQMSAAIVRLTAARHLVLLKVGSAGFGELDALDADALRPLDRDQRVE